MKDINEAFMAKWAWNILSQTGGDRSVWLRLVEGKYLKGQDFLLINPKHSDSWIWKAILKSRRTLQLGACRVVNSTNCISAWDDPWVPSMPQYNPKPRRSTIKRASLTVKDLITMTGEWNVNLLKECFDDTSVKAILKIPIPNALQLNNPIWFWAPASSGCFSIKSAYNSIIRHRRQVTSQMNSQTWRLLWRMRIHPRLQIRWWCVLSNALPTRSRLSALFSD